MDLNPLRITAPKGAWLSPATITQIETHNSAVDRAAADLATLRTDLESYQATDFAVANLAELASARQAMLGRLLSWHQSALTIIRNRPAVCALIVADAQGERARVEAQLAARRQTVADGLKALGMDPKTAGPDPEAEKLAGSVAALRSIGPSLTPNNGSGIAKIKNACTAALTMAMLQGLPALPDADAEV